MIACLETFRGALLADAVGLGKTYISLAAATRYSRTAVIAPAALVSQWRNAAARMEVSIRAVTIESLSRHGRPPSADLIIVDEAHRFRNPRTRRYDRLARGVRDAPLLLVTATPVVNRAADLVHLLRLFLPNHGLAMLGVDSLERFIGSRTYDDLLSAVAPLVVARPAIAVPTVAALIPHPCDGAVCRAPPVSRDILVRLVAVIDSLTFPGFGSPLAVGLMRRQLCHRLASSAAAFRESVMRHLRYIDRALVAAARGERLTRFEARRLFDLDGDLQFELEELGSPGGVSHDPRELRAERARLTQLAAATPVLRTIHPKTARLLGLLRERRGRKTIVFTTAIATALDLGRACGWRRVTVVGGGRAWIASGRIGVEEALSLFAPTARSATPPPASTTVEALIATDLASEGLDLQDADGIVHYDLPWTPVRLAQRLGRIARIGSPHRTVGVWWFAPPPSLARRIGVEPKLDQKARTQLMLGVPTTSTVGRASVANALARWRGDLAASAAPLPPERAGFATVASPTAAAFAVRWCRGPQEVPQLLVFHGTPLRLAHHQATAWTITHRMAQAPRLEGEPPAAALGALRRLIRTRIQATERAPLGPDSRRLARLVLRRSRHAVRRRAALELQLLDNILNRLELGLAVGAERDLAAVVDRGTPSALRTWLGRYPVSQGYGPPVCRLEASLFGIAPHP